MYGFSGCVFKTVGCCCSSNYRSLAIPVKSSSSSLIIRLLIVCTSTRIRFLGTQPLSNMQGTTTTKEMQWSQSLLFTPKLPMEGKAISDYLTPKATRSPSPAYRRERSISPGSFRRRSLTPASSFRETPPPPSDTLLDSPLPGACCVHAETYIDSLCTALVHAYTGAGLATPATPLDDAPGVSDYHHIPRSTMPLIYAIHHPSNAVLAEAIQPTTTRTGGQHSLIPAAALRQAEVTDGWVTVFGFQPQQLEIVLQEFQKCGDIEQFGTFGQGQNTNWVHIQFQVGILTTCAHLHTSPCCRCVINQRPSPFLVVLHLLASP